MPPTLVMIVRCDSGACPMSVNEVPSATNTTEKPRMKRSDLSRMVRLSGLSRSA